MKNIEVYAICEADSIKPGWAHPFNIERVNANGVPEPLSIVIARDNNDNFYAYRNVCPHQQQFMYGRPEELLGVDDLLLICRKHSAKFFIDSGLCSKGPCEGVILEGFPAVVIDGEVCLAGVTLTVEGADGPEVMITSD